MDEADGPLIRITSLVPGFGFWVFDNCIPGAIASSSCHFSFLDWLTALLICFCARYQMIMTHEYPFEFRLFQRRGPGHNYIFF